jgi:hypothetical protein
VLQLNGGRTPDHKNIAPLAIALCAISLFCISARAQSPSKTSKERSSRKRAVALETVLSCADDPLIGEVFKTGGLAARVNLNGFLMIESKHTLPPAEYLSLRGKGFVTRPIDDTTLQIMPTSPVSGSPIPIPTLPFCNDLPIAHYDEAETKSGPRAVDIDGKNWILNANEIFAHADQFHFDSGVFTNSSDVFFTATKGRTSIQFISQTDGLKFYRAIYLPGD